LGADDAQLVGAVAPGDDFGRAITQALVDISSREGGEVYRLAYRLTVPTLRDGMGHEYDGAKGDDPDRYLGNADPQPLHAFYALEGRGLRRAATALRLWEARFESSRGNLPPLVPVQRSVAMLLPYHDAAAARRAAYKPAPAERNQIAWVYPATVLAIVVVGVAVLVRRRRRGRRVPVVGE
jgi:hypothetical protein